MMLGIETEAMIFLFAGLSGITVMLVYDILAVSYTHLDVYKRQVDTGIEHGTVTVLIGKDSFEVTTYRIDGLYEDSRHPKEVIFTNQLEEDLRRRDFTINAMAYNDEVRLVDVFGGMQDLNRHLIRCVGNPKERFS